ncbi:MAG: cytochrome c family protein [Pseudomonadota bacterium]
MLDTMTATKVTAALCGSLLVFLLGAWAAEEIYHMGGHGHGDHHEQAYSIDTGHDDDHGEVEEGPTVAEVLAAADAGKGERVFNKCRACHQLEAGVNGTGPYLYAVVNRTIGAVDGFGYSGVLSGMTDQAWTPENLYAFLENPKGFAPGTSMSFNGLAKSEDRANLIAYLETFGG